MTGPDQSSGEDTGLSRTDSAYDDELQGLGAHLAQLAFPEHEHTHQQYVAGFSERMIAAGNYSLPLGQEGEPRYCLSTTATETSMAVTRASRTTCNSWSSERTPSLVSGPATLKSFSTIRSSQAGSAVKPALLDEEGCLIGGPVQPLRCLFSFLACEETFSSVEEWLGHSKFHFHSSPPPGNLLCAFPYCGWQSQELDGEEAWEDRRRHFLNNHNVFVECHLPWKKDVPLFKHLWKIHIVNSAQLQELREFGQLNVETAAYTSSEGASRHRDREGRRPRTGGSYAPRSREP